MIVVLCEADKRPAAVDGHASRRNRPTERVLEVGLEERVGERPAGGAVWEFEVDDQGAVGPEPLVSVDGQQIVEQLVRDAEQLQDAHHLVVETDRARKPVGRGEALVHRRLDSVAAEQGCGRRADRSVADDHDVVLLLHECHLRPSTSSVRPWLTRSRPSTHLVHYILCTKLPSV